VAGNYPNGGLSGNIPDGTTDHIWQDSQVMEERNPFGGTGSTDTPIKQYIWGSYIDECIQLTTYTILGSQSLPAGAYYLLQDLLYRAAALTDFTGTVVEAYDTDAYGNTIIFTGPGTDGICFTDDDVQSSYGANEIIFCGYRFDSESDLYYVRNRSYNAALGRWLQRDLIGFSGGINLYGYVGGGPISGADATGMRKVSINIGIPGEFDALVSAFEKLAKDLKELEKPFHYLPGVHPYFNFIPWRWEKSPELKGEADFEGLTLCSASVEAIGGGSVGAQGGVSANTELVTGKIGLVLKLAFEFGVTAEYKYKKGWNFGGGAGGTVSLDLAGTIEAWLVKATAYGGAQGYITGTVMSDTGDLVVKLGAGGIAGVAVQYRTPFGPWETLVV
jgi:RHS repeat-associated protein